LKNIPIITICATVAILIFAACQKDTFVETTGVCPIVVSTNPVNGAINVPLNTKITVTFNEKMNPLTITQGSFSLHGTTFVSGVISYSDSTAYFTPTSNLAQNTTYTGRVSTSVKDLTGNALQTDYIWTFRTQAALGAPLVELNTAARFGILASEGVSNNAGQSEIRNMDVGVISGFRASITGFPPAIIVNGAMYAFDDIIPAGIAAMLTLSKQEMINAYLFAQNAAFPVPVVVSGDLGGTTLLPGIYKTTSTMLVQSGDLKLDAQGDTSAVWIFQVASDLTTVGGAGGNILLTGGAQAKNVFWQVGSSATIGDFTSFKGTILALTSITMESGAIIEGRLLAQNGAVVLTNTNIISKP